MSWSLSHYGLVPGVDDGMGGWQNGTATVTLTTDRDASGRVIATSAVGNVGPGATNAEMAKGRGYEYLAGGFSFSTKTFDMTYNYLGQMTFSRYEKMGPETYSGKKGRLYVGFVATAGTTSQSNFDQFGRAGTVYSTYVKSVNRSSGWSNTTNIVYNELGNVVSQNEKYYS